MIIVIYYQKSTHDTQDIKGNYSGNNISGAVTNSFNTTIVGLKNKMTSRLGYKNQQRDGFFETRYIVDLVTGTNLEFIEFYINYNPREIINFDVTTERGLVSGVEYTKPAKAINGDIINHGKRYYSPSGRYMVTMRSLERINSDLMFEYPDNIQNSLTIKKVGY